ncbi:uncharacterized protein MYCFIDRAFT_207726 [Pseudocercospora fijiensis CIRAD86]|uniref:Secreted protein n=1 Tax=Pseudocercospora fijiensis (strain CIRAD86) TaxID=383855 RepID=M3B1H5_PSEFD|nr:uncharacterized protein MYCFIDRAFT_207726 [Pseudocercospora fijiensis CIRAD86]EME83208.1 hypothetical protein MYCFIDRAFT_207726 [Pseudocercospora fijiensis CIRAD86]
MREHTLVLLSTALACSRLAWHCLFSDAKPDHSIYSSAKLWEEWVTFRDKQVIGAEFRSARSVSDTEHEHDLALCGSGVPCICQRPVDLKFDRERHKPDGLTRLAEASQAKGLKGCQIFSSKATTDFASERRHISCYLSESSTA